MWTEHFNGDLSRGEKFHLSIKIKVNLLTNDYDVWTETKAPYLLLTHKYQERAAHRIELSMYTFCSENASSNSHSQLNKIWEKESVKEIQIFVLSLNCVHFILVIWFHSHKPFGHLFETRGSTIYPFMKEENSMWMRWWKFLYNSFSFSYDQSLFFCCICWTKFILVICCNDEEIRWNDQVYKRCVVTKGKHFDEEFMYFQSKY